VYCPNCGSKNNKNQNFCRYCGFNLTETSKSLKLQLAFGERAYKLKKSDKVKRVLNGISDVLLAGFFIGLFAIVLFDGSKIGTFIKVSLIIYTIFQFAAWVINYFQRDESAKSIALEERANAVENYNLQPKKTNKLLEESSFEPIPSITENPTAILHADPKTRKFE
jgi:hypothetical protein